MTEQDDEAIHLLGEATRALTETPKDIELAVRKYAQACELLGWRQQADEAWGELSGFQAANVPHHRLIRATKTWVPSPELGAYDRIHAATTQEVMGGVTPPDEPVDWYVLSPLVDVLRKRQTGWAEPTNEAPRRYSERGTVYPFLQIIRVPASGLVAIGDRVEQWIFRAAVSASMTLRFGREAETLWSRFRQRVDAPLAGFDLAAHLEPIESGIAANNAAGRRSALYACRTLLEDLANAIWLDPREVYTPLPGGGEGGRLQVSRGHTKNRLAAYLHQHLGRTEVERYLEAELERLVSSLARLYDLANEAHDDQVTQEDAETAVVGTYICIAEIVRHTGLQPLTTYSEPSA